MTARFRQENTEGYSDADLAPLNAAFEEIMNANADLWANDTSPGRDLAFKSWQDNVAEELLFRYDQGRRGGRAANDPVTNSELNDAQTEALIRELEEISGTIATFSAAGRRIVVLRVPTGRNLTEMAND